jgi:hypothetical protein
MTSVNAFMLMCVLFMLGTVIANTSQLRHDLNNVLSHQVVVSAECRR